MSSFWISALADGAVRATALLGITAALAALAGRRSAALRHFVWALALAGVLVLPLAGAALPEVPVPIPAPWTPGRQSVAAVGNGPARAAPRVGPHAPHGVEHAAGSADVAGTRDTGPATGPPAGAVRASAGAGASEASRPDPATVPAAGWSTLSLAIWGVGAAAFAAWSLAGIWNTRRLVAQATPVTAREWLDPLHDACARLDIRRPVRLLQSDCVAMPMTWGWRRPVVLLPATACGWQSARRTVVLRHELAHVKRADVVTQLLAQWACVVYWFNPVVWLAAFRLRVEREQACDDAVLGLGTRASDYANHLLDIARECHAPGLTASAAVAMARRSQLEFRLRAILDPTVRRAAERSTAVLAAVVLTGALLAVSAVTPVTETFAEPTVQGGLGANATGSVPGSAAGAEPPAAVISAPPVASAGASPAQAEPAPEAWFDRWHRAAEEAFAAVIWHVSEARRQLGGAAAGTPPGVENSMPAPLPAESEGDPLGAVESQLASAFIDALRDPDANVRARAARALGQHRVHAAATVLRTALGDEDAGVRKRAAWALGRIRDDAAVDSLLNLLRDPVQEVRERAAWALGALRSPAAVDGLVAALADADAAVQERIAWALGRIRGPRATRGLITALTVIAGDALHEVIEALARTGGEPAMEALIGLMDTDDPEVRRAVIDALSRGKWISTDESADTPVPPVPPRG